MSSLFSLILFNIKMPVLDANNVVPDQTPLYAAPDLGLHCLPMSLLWDDRHARVKVNTIDIADPRIFRRHLT